MLGRVLITGVTGMVGSALARRLVAEGVSVTGSLRTSAESHQTLPGVDYVVVGEVDSTTDWSVALQGAEHVVHTAALTAEHEPAALQRVNVEGTAAIAAAAADRVESFILLSSLGVHGCTSPERSIRADDIPAPHDAYSSSKLAAEQAMLRRLRESSTKWVIVRPPMIYGAGSRGTPRRLQQAVRRGWPLPLGAVRNRRSVIGAANLADFIWFALRHEQAYGATWLVADAEDLSTPQLLRLVAQAEGVSLTLPWVPLSLLRLLGKLAGRGRDISRLTDSLCIDRSAVREQLGWIPPRSTLAEWQALMAAESTDVR